jgi:galactokinase
MQTQSYRRAAREYAIAMKAVAEEAAEAIESGDLKRAGQLLDSAQLHGRRANEELVKIAKSLARRGLP